MKVKRKIFFSKVILVLSYILNFRFRGYEFIGKGYDNFVFSFFFSFESFLCFFENFVFFCNFINLIKNMFFLILILFIKEKF